MDEQVVLEATIEDIIYQNKENGYTVCTVEYEGEEISCVGEMAGVYAGEDIKLVGHWTTHPVYGKQIKVMYFERSMPKTVQGMEKYLASGVIKGIGAKTAKKIVKHFGLETFRIIEEEPLVLAQVSGISEKKAQEIGEVFHAQYELRQAMLFLQDYGITPTYAIKIYKQYKNKTMEVVKNTPYRLVEDIFGIGFKKADEIAQKVGITHEDPHRIKTGVIYILSNFSANGHTYMPRENLVKEAVSLLGLNAKDLIEDNGEPYHPLVENALIELNLGKQIIIKVYGEKKCVFLAYLYYSEQAVARKLIDLAALYEPSTHLDIEKELIKTQKELQIELVEEQKEAIKHVLTYGVTVITGGPGTGKTTTINALLNMLEKAGDEVLLAAPTGRAAKRMSEATGIEAQTIHRLLEINYIREDASRQMFNRNEENPLEADVIIVDEMSMVDITLMHALLKAVVEGQRLVLIGDADQLPSVGAGNVLKDIIKSKRLPVVRLVQIFRQASQSAIIRNAHLINKGEYPITNEKDTDFFFMTRGAQEDVKNTIIELITSRLPKYQGFDSLKDIQVLVPMRKGIVGVNELNKALQEAINPPQPLKPQKEYRGVLFREGDKVMQIKNNYNTPWKILAKTGLPIDEGVGIFNGDCGLITGINEETEILIVTFDDQKVVEYEFNQLDELELAYAVTIHKSQGSEYPAVILPIHSGPPMLLNRNLLYTAVTRAKKLVVAVGLRETMERMVDNNKEIERYSSLVMHLTGLI
ncbi:ATP-dependent RecD-like DNA helicase [Sporanaerobium hydrogeniformans]|uniref:ATP-dependent RecD-like DNA helicase n=1 Tax=Sporanaerobium hydrogeniformans TaxID=3072179 RepID=A0AC61D987_9FIRM|nr:ATP-dependent RecD-like DNA helicase [Sporanaerobium hydrogeniformans]PHV69840.1 ATP-dependent RecD-like DNA helicase [Sporanaerobium hydrogeniformans]